MASLVRRSKGMSVEKYGFLTEEELFDARIRNCSRRIGHDLYGSPVVIDAGISRLTQSFLASVTQKGDYCITCPSFYHAAATWCHYFGVKLYQSNSEVAPYKMTAEELDRDIALLKRQGQVKCLILTNPTITGYVYSLQELASIVQVCNYHDITIFEDLVFSGTEHSQDERVASISSIDKQDSLHVSAYSVSKSQGLANLRFAYAWGNSRLISQMKDYKLAFTTCVPRVAVEMSLTAMQHSNHSLRTVACEMKARVSLIHRELMNFNRFSNERIGRDGVSLVHSPSAGHSVLISLHGMKHILGQFEIRDNIDLVRYFMDNERLALSPAFTIGYKGLEVRINFGDVGSHYTYWLPRSIGLRLGRSHMIRTLQQRFFAPLRSMLR